MSRFLAAALVMVARAPAPRGERPAAEGFGGFGGFGENGKRPPPEPIPWPEGVDYWLTYDAARFSGLVSAGCEWRWCPDGGIDVMKPDDRMWMLSPGLARRLQEADLLLPVVMAGRP